MSDRARSQSTSGSISRHERVKVELSVRVLRNTLRIAGKERVDTVPVRLALRCLLPHCPERWPLTSFWEAAGQDRELNRSQGVTAAFNGIVRQLRRSGAVADVSFFGKDP